MKFTQQLDAVYSILCLIFQIDRSYISCVIINLSFEIFNYTYKISGFYFIFVTTHPVLIRLSSNSVTIITTIAINCIPNFIEIRKKKVSWEFFEH